MRLQSIELLGFKSFADRTRLEFGSGMSVIVGPNGTGKSNIVDSVAWVLGSQFTRSLRADQMEDVIFAGTADRPAHSRAEVTLVLDNADGTAPIDVEEVAIRRRLFRGGSSEYEVNGVACRLLDIQELLSDSGLGRRQHLIVGQGRLNAVLGGNADHRREVIEDAAGILKHRLRRSKALRRLGEAEADMVRLADINRELKRRMRPLQRQAEQAIRYGKLREELRHLRIVTAGVELRALAQRQEQVRGEEKAAEDRISEIDEERGRVRDVRARIEEESAERWMTVEHQTRNITVLREAMSRCRGIAQLAQERSRTLGSRIKRKESAYQELTDRIARLAEESREAAGQEDEARSEITHRREALTAAERLLNEAPEDTVGQMQRELVSLEKNLQRLAGHSERTGSAIKARTIRLRETQAELGRQNDRSLRIGAELESQEGQLEAVRIRYRQARQSRRRLEAELAEANKAVDQAQIAQATARASLKVLRSDRVGAQEGTEIPDGVIGGLMEVMEVSGPLTAAVEVALGAWARALVMEDGDNMAATIAAMTEGREEPFPAVSTQSLQARPPAPSDVSRTLAGMVDPSGTKPWVAGLLGDFLLVDSWLEGWELVKRDPDRSAVTVRGDLVTYFGVIPADPNRGPFGLAVAEAEDRQAQVALAEARRVRSQAQAGLAKAKSDEDKSAAEVRELESRIARSVGAQQKSRSLRDTLLARIEDLQDAVGRLCEEDRELKDRIAQLRQRITATEKQLDETTPRDALSREVLVQRCREARAAWEASIHRLGAATERGRMLGDQIDMAQTRLSRGPLVQGDVTIRDEMLRIAGWASEIEAASVGKLGKLTARRERFGQADRAATLRLTGLRDRLGGLDSERESLVEASRRLAGERSKLDIRHDAVAAQLRREYDCPVEQALTADEPAETPEALERRIEKLVRQSARMGPVNPLAEEELADLNDRHQHLSSQMADVERARSELKNIIAGLDDSIHRLFTSTFEDVARHYRDCLSILFPGGTGDLILSDADNPLEAAVEIKAQPLGKKVGKMALLSGGERSLAALAFLFGVFKARPGPFHILDEVDAELDDANLGRFLRLVEDFGDHAQLIFVTHQHATVRVADTLYGVTMSPGGSSKALMRRMGAKPLHTVPVPA